MFVFNGDCFPFFLILTNKSCVQINNIMLVNGLSLFIWETDLRLYHEIGLGKNVKR